MNSPNKVVALLPMKGHSERVPNKNMRLFDGKPLYHMVANTLENSPCIESVLIDTDSEIIAADAVKNFSKVVIIDRPAELHGDFVEMNDIIKYDLGQVDSEHFIQTHSTNPLLTGETIEKAVSQYFATLGSYDSLFSVTRLQTRLYWESGQAVNHDPSELLRTQDLPPVFEENSNIFIFSKKSFSNAGNKRIGKTPQMFPMDKLEAVDIDEEIDFKLAETLHKMRKETLNDHAI